MPFEKKGWPHCDAMDLLVPSKAKGQHAYQGMQRAPTAGSSSTLLTPFDSVPSSTSSAKRKQFSFNISGQSSESSSSKKRSKMSDSIVAINNLLGVFGGLNESLHTRQDLSLGPGAQATR